MFSKNILINKFYKEHLPFELTGAQKKVLWSVMRICLKENK